VPGQLFAANIRGLADACLTNLSSGQLIANEKKKNMMYTDRWTNRQADIVLNKKILSKIPFCFCNNFLVYLSFYLYL
jgi:hypothetical protein